jgi:hypothetical protein
VGQEKRNCFHHVRPSMPSPQHHFQQCHSTSTKLQRIEEYLASDKLPELSDADVAAIDEAGSQETHRHFVSFRIIVAPLLDQNLLSLSSTRWTRTMAMVYKVCNYVHPTHGLTVTRTITV